MTPPVTLAEILDRLHTLRRHALDGPQDAGPSMASLRVAQGVCERLAGLLGHGVGMPAVVAPDGDGGMVLRWPEVEVGVGYLGAMATLACGVTAAGGPWQVAVGALAFTASDVAVARDRFVKREFLNRAWGLPLYYGAQLLIAATPALLLP